MKSEAIGVRNGQPMSRLLPHFLIAFHARHAIKIVQIKEIQASHMTGEKLVDVVLV